MIAIIDYGVGNVKSISNMLKKIKVPNIISSNADDLVKADKLILPGVGSFDYAMKKLRMDESLYNAINKMVLQDEKPILGICLGMQLMTNGSEEGVEKGLGWVDANVRNLSKLVNSGYKVPHMGWNDLTWKSKEFLNDDLEKSRFYFVHSYYVECVDEKNVLGTTTYDKEITVALHKKNIWGTQFHPEKSHKFGMKLLSNFSRIEN